MIGNINPNILQYFVAMPGFNVFPPFQAANHGILCNEGETKLVVKWIGSAYNRLSDELVSYGTEDSSETQIPQKLFNDSLYLLIRIKTIYASVIDSEENFNSEEDFSSEEDCSNEEGITFKEKIIDLYCAIESTHNSILERTIIPPDLFSQTLCWGIDE